MFVISKKRNKNRNFGSFSNSIIQSTYQFTSFNYFVQQVLDFSELLFHLSYAGLKLLKKTLSKRCDRFAIQYPFIQNSKTKGHFIEKFSMKTIKVELQTYFLSIFNILNQHYLVSSFANSIFSDTLTFIDLSQISSHNTNQK